MDLSDEEHGPVKRHEMGYAEPGFVADMAERNINERNGENNNETWAMVVSMRKQEGKTNGQERKGDLQSTEGIGSEKEVREKRNDLSQ